MPLLKYCHGCEQTLPAAEFNRHRNKPDGLRSRCRTCDKAARRYDDAERARLRGHYYAKHAQRIAAGKRWRAANADKHRACVADWAKRHPTAVLANNHAYRARRKKAKGRFTAAEWTAKCGEYGNRCAYCRKRTKLTAHHVVPLAVGGDNYIDNIVPACATCNSKIGTATIRPEAVTC